MQKTGKIKSLIKDKNGFTLVELLVSFTLLLILMGAAVAVILPSTRVCVKAVSAGRMQNVSNILMDRMMNELGAAAEIIQVDDDKLEYIDDGGNYVVMETKLTGEEGKQFSILQLTYPETEGGKKWEYPEKMYMGSGIEELKFSEVADRTDLIQIDLKLKNRQSEDEYERSRVVKCYALEEE